MSPLTDENGKLDLAAVENLSESELRDWIFARLHSQDMLVPGGFGRAELPHFLLTQIYPQLSRPARQDMENIVEDFVRKMARHNESEWQGDAADELLLLAQTVCGGTTINQAVIGYIEEMAQSLNFFNADNDGQIDLHYRLLQSLVALGWRGRPEFWREQVRRASKRYTGVAFSGLALISPKEAVALLTEIEWSDAVEDQIFTNLPDFLEEYQISCVLPLFQRYLPAMRERTRAAICGYMAEEGIPLALTTVTSTKYEPHRDFFRKRDLPITLEHAAT